MCFQGLNNCGLSKFITTKKRFVILINILGAKRETKPEKDLCVRKKMTKK